MASKIYSHDFANGLGPWTGSGWTTEAGALRMDYPNFNSSHQHDNGGTGYADISRSVTEFTLCWEEKYSSNWVWSPVATKGWQLETPRGVSSGWKIYLLNDQSSQGSRGTILYNGSYRTLQHPWVQPRGTWGKFRTYIKLNDPGVANGVYEFYFDDELVSRYDSVNFRSTNEPISRFMLSGYWNSSSNGASHPAMTRWVKNIELYEGRAIVSGEEPVEPENPPEEPEITPTPPNSSGENSAVGEYTLNWAHSGMDLNGNPADLTGFRVMLMGLGEVLGPTPLDSLARRYTWGGLKPGKYEVSLWALNEHGKSTVSKQMFVIDNPGTVPEPPEIV